MAAVIECEDVHKLYDADTGVRGLSLTVPAGHILGLIGPSGSGKTTTVRLMAGLLSRDSGTLRVLDEDPDTFDRAIRRRLGYLPQSTVLYPALSLRENLEFVGALYGLPRAARKRSAGEMLEIVDLGDAADRRLVEASGGMKRRLGLGAAMIHRPDVLFLDEPTAGLDPILRASLWDVFRKLRDDGNTLIVTTQYVGEAAFCDTIALLAGGEVVEHGEPEALRWAAFGGELVDVVFSERPTWAAIDELRASVSAHDLQSTGVREIRLTVDDAGTAIPLITETAERLGVQIAEVERHVPDFDDAFVRIVKRHNGEEAGN